MRHILTNRIYLGEISHKGSVYPGTHCKIVVRHIWKASQIQLSGAKPRPCTGLIVLLDRDLLADMFAVELPAEGLTDPVEINVPASLRRRGQELRLFYTTPHTEPADRDDRLIELLGQGWAALEELLNGARIADSVRRSYLCRLARLKFLAPDITTAILDGRQPVELTARSLLRANDLPVSWPEQRTLLGIA